MTRAALFVVGGLLAVCVTACGTERGSEPTSAAAASGTTTSQEPTTDIPVDDPTANAPAFPENTALQFEKNSGEWDLVLTDVTVAEHESFDRIVLVFAGTGVPGWAVSYVDEAVLDGSGEVVTLGGDAFVDIYASGTTWPADDYYSGPRHVETEKGTVEDVYVAGTFEGYTQVLAGIDGDRVPFRVFALTDPSRLMIDIVDGSTD